MSLFYTLANVSSQFRSLLEYNSPQAGSASVFLVFLLLLCIGAAVALGLIVYCIKRPIDFKLWEAGLAGRALPGRLVAALLAVVVSLYLIASFSYLLLFPAAELDPNALVFQTLVFHVPVLAVLVILLRRAKISGHELFGIDWKRAPKLLGLSVLFYLGALPLLWFYSLLYQVFLRQIGHDFYMQDVVQVLAADATWPLRISMFFIAIVVAPVFEEIVFRGVLFPWLVRRIRLWPAVLLVSVLFAGLHFHIPSLVPLFLLSGTFCLAYARTQSLLVPVGMHALFNSVTVLILVLAGG